MIEEIEEQLEKDDLSDKKREDLKNKRVKLFSKCGRTTFEDRWTNPLNLKCVYNDSKGRQVHVFNDGSMIPLGFIPSSIPKWFIYCHVAFLAFLIVQLVLLVISAFDTGYYRISEFLGFIANAMVALLLLGTLKYCKDVVEKYKSLGICLYVALIFNFAWVVNYVFPTLKEFYK